MSAASEEEIEKNGASNAAISSRRKWPLRTFICMPSMRGIFQYGAGWRLLGLFYFHPGDIWRKRSIGFQETQ